MARNVISAAGGICTIGAYSKPIQKEIEMFTKRYFSLIVAAVLVIVIVFAVQQVSAIRSNIYTESSSQLLREYQLGERYGESSQNSAISNAERIQREYVLGERYGVTPQQYTQAQIQREYWLGERYRQTP